MMGPFVWLLQALALFAGMILLAELGRRIGRKRIARDPEGARAGLASAEGAVFALLGLLIAFTFSGAASRFDNRRQMAVQEANNIGTAWLRIDLLPPEAQPALRDLFRRYLDARVEIYRQLPDVPKAKQSWERANELQSEIWEQTVAACRTEEGRPVTTPVVTGLNQMIDITTTRTMAFFQHPPRTIFVMLFVLALGCSLLAGHSMAAGKERSWTHMVGFAAILSITFYVILEIEHPRAGFIRVNAADLALTHLRETMK